MIGRKCYPCARTHSNIGLVALSAGITDFRGRVNNAGAGRIITSGGAVVTFHDGFQHNGAQFKVSAASSVVAFGLVTGAGSFTGPGTLYFEGGCSPGNSSAIVEIGTNLVLGDDNLLTLEIGGLVAGARYDQLALNPTASLTVGGELQLTLTDGFVPNVGDSFQLLDFEPGQVSGEFASITLDGMLPPGATLEMNTLLVDGLVTVVPEPSGAMLILAGGIGLLRRRRAG